MMDLLSLILLFITTFTCCLTVSGQNSNNGGMSAFQALDDLRQIPTRDIGAIVRAMASAVPGRTYPILSSIPSTGFTCDQVPQVGYYADTETGCQVFRMCLSDNTMKSFICSNQTLFNQITLVCDWWYNVNCSKSPTYYSFSNPRIYQQNMRFLDDGNSVDIGSNSGPRPSGRSVGSSGIIPASQTMARPATTTARPTTVRVIRPQGRSLQTSLTSQRFTEPHDANFYGAMTTEGLQENRWPGYDGPTDQYDEFTETTEAMDQAGSEHLSNSAYASGAAGQREAGSLRIQVTATPRVAPTQHNIVPGEGGHVQVAPHGNPDHVTSGSETSEHVVPHDTASAHVDLPSGEHLVISVQQTRSGTTEASEVHGEEPVELPAAETHTATAQSGYGEVGHGEPLREGHAVEASHGASAQNGLGASAGHETVGEKDHGEETSHTDPTEEGHAAEAGHAVSSPEEPAAVGEAGHAVSGPSHTSETGHAVSKPSHTSETSHAVSGPSHTSETGHAVSGPSHTSETGHAVTGQSGHSVAAGHEVSGEAGGHGALGASHDVAAQGSHTALTDHEVSEHNAPVEAGHGASAQNGLGASAGHETVGEKDRGEETSHADPTEEGHAAEAGHAVSSPEEPAAVGEAGHAVSGPSHTSETGHVVSGPSHISETGHAVSGTSHTSETGHAVTGQSGHSVAAGHEVSGEAGGHGALGASHDVAAQGSHTAQTGHEVSEHNAPVEAGRAVSSPGNHSAASEPEVLEGNHQIASARESSRSPSTDRNHAGAAAHAVVHVAHEGSHTSVHTAEGSTHDTGRNLQVHRPAVGLNPVFRNRTSAAKPNASIPLPGMLFSSNQVPLPNNRFPAITTTQKPLNQTFPKKSDKTTTTTPLSTTTPKRKILVRVEEVTSGKPKIKESNIVVKKGKLFPTRDLKESELKSAKDFFSRMQQDEPGKEGLKAEVNGGKVVAGSHAISPGFFDGESRATKGAQSMSVSLTLPTRSTKDRFAGFHKRF